MVVTATSTDVAAPLLDHLREAFDDPNLTYAEPPEPVLGGYETIIYGFRLDSARPEIAGPLIVRIFRADGGIDRARGEATIQNTLADLGYAVPRVLAASTGPGVLAAGFTVMERLPGRTML
jgi:hypothetical protein